MRRIVIIVLVALGTTVLAWETAESFYFAKPIAGRVVEWRTSTGLQDVTVVADWQLQGGLGGFGPRGHVVILETKTDADGRFALPGWGPRFALPRGRLRNRDPMLLFFKAGYFPRELLNRDESNSWVRTSDWDGATVSMDPASRRPDQYADAVQNFVLAGSVPGAVDEPREDVGWAPARNSRPTSVGPSLMLPSRKTTISGLPTTSSIPSRMKASPIC